MKKIICALFLTFAFFIGISQPIDVNWGVENKYVKNQRSQNIIGETEESLFTFNNRPRGLFRKASFSFLKFNKKDFKLEKTVTVQLPKQKGKKLYFNSSLMIGDQIMFLYNSFDKKTKKITLLGQKVSQDGVVANKTIELGNVDAVDGRFLGRNLGAIQTVLNDSRDKFLVVEHIPRPKRNSKERIHLSVFDKNIEKSWGADFEIPYTDRNFIIYKTMLDEKGNAYVLGKKYMEKEKVKKNGKVKVKRKTGLFSKNVNYEFAILYYDVKTKKVKDYKINLKDKHIIDIDLKVNDEESIVCGGFYFPKGVQWVPNIKGTFFARINRKSGEIDGQSAKEFDDKFLNVIRDGKVFSWYWTDLGLMWGELTRGKDVTRKGGLKNFRMRDFEIRKDGSAVIVAEGYRMLEVENRDGEVIKRYYYYDDIIVVNVEPDGNISWYARVPKKQISVNDGGYYSSYFMKVNGDDVYFVFNDRQSNNSRLKKGKNAAYLKYPKRASTTLVKLDRKGQMERKKLFTNRDLDLSLVPKETRNYQNYQSGVSIMYGLDFRWYNVFGGAKYRYGSVKL